MSDDAEQQAEEIEVLKSIYEGDENFKQIDAKTYQYKVCMCPVIIRRNLNICHGWPLNPAVGDPDF